MARRFVALDRDGTLIVKQHYLSDPDQVKLLPGAVAGLRQMRALGFGLVVLTNQSAIGRGLFNLRRLEVIHERLCALLAAESVTLDGIYSCPHRPEDGCRCRKPETGLLDRAAAEWDFDPRACTVIGDNVCDVELGLRVGATTLLVRTGEGAGVEAASAAHPHYTVDDLADAAQRLGHIYGPERSPR
jgi:D-glycero-D-manno-heptose 1,7-bisphosphate phosphatase